MNAARWRPASWISLTAIVAAWVGGMVILQKLLAMYRELDVVPPAVPLLITRQWWILVPVCALSLFVSLSNRANVLLRPLTIVQFLFLAVLILGIWGTFHGLAVLMDSQGGP